MKLLYCQTCGDIVAPFRTNNKPRYCQCESYAIWWLDAEKGIARVYSACGERSALILGINNHFLTYPGKLTKEIIQTIADACPDTYLFKKLNTSIIRISPGESSDTGWSRDLPTPCDHGGKLGGSCSRCGVSSRLEPQDAEALAENIKKVTEAQSEPMPEKKELKSSLTNDPEEARNSGIDPVTKQQNLYYVLSEEERAKGFVRPVRKKYKHVGIRPVYPTRELTAEEHERYDKYGYVCFEPYPEGSPTLGRYWTKKQLESGCGTVTTMGQALAETWAVDITIYGATFCCHCSKHIDVKELVWDDDGSVLGT